MTLASPPFSLKQFQFYDSPIKNTLFDDGLPAPAEFQFYDSPIKRKSTTVLTFAQRGFNSTIVRLKDTRIASAKGNSAFQFYDSAIKRIMKMSQTRSIAKVSILR